MTLHRSGSLSRSSFHTVFALGVFLAAMPAAVAAEGLMPHQAIYELSLPKAGESGSAVVGASGRMFFRQERTCDSWLVANRLQVVLNLANGETTGLETDQQFVEALDGDRMTFRVSQRMADTQVALSGEAARQPDGGILATFQRPQGAAFEMPAGTLFPMAHTKALIAAAEAGQQQHTAFVFDGSLPEMFEISSFVLGQSDHPFPADPSGAVAEDPAWRIRIAYFQASKAETQPSTEMSMILYGNGVTADVVLDLDGIALAATPRSFKRLPEPDC